LIIIFFFAQV